MLEVVKIAVECTYVQGEMKEIKGEEWDSKGMDGCPRTTVTIMVMVTTYCRKDTRW
jgi:hypothetical protein